jgi:glutamate-ammonia-ligase adenylyltransferase
MEGRVDADGAGLARSALADAAIEALLPRVLDDFASRNGMMRGGELAVVALGKAGGREMMASSDLDLMMVYDHPENVVASTPPAGGTRKLAASQWFLRACNAFIAALTAPGADGPLYAVDMRLRPSGNKGPVAVSLSSFRRYHAESAWTWERMALTRARVIAGPARLRARVATAIDQALVAVQDPARVRVDAAAMRARMLRDLPPDGPWDVKLRPGGQVEVEFIAQALQLIRAPAVGGRHESTTRLALAELAAEGALPDKEAEMLVAADRLWRTIQGMLRITIGRSAGHTLPTASGAALLRATEPLTGAVDLVSLRATMETTAARVRQSFIRHVGEIEQ